MAAKTKQSVPADPLDALAAAGPEEAIKMLLWANRFANPEFAVIVRADDLKGFNDCVQYLGVTPKIVIRRPPGQPAHPGLPPSKRYPEGVPPREAEPPRPYVQISMVDQDGNAFKPIENSEENARVRDRANELAAIKARIPILASAIMGGIANKTFSESEIIELCNSANRLALS